MRPTLLRPPRCRLLSTSAECGPPLCRPGVTTLTKARRPGDVGLALMSGISLVSLYPEPALGLLSGQVDLAARRPGDVGLALMSGISLVSLYPEPALGLLSGQVDLAARRQAHIGLLPVAA